MRVPSTTSSIQQPPQQPPVESSGADSACGPGGCGDSGSSQGGSSVEKIIGEIIELLKELLSKGDSGAQAGQGGGDAGSKAGPAPSGGEASSPKGDSGAQAGPSGADAAGPGQGGGEAASAPKGDGGAQAGKDGADAPTGGNPPQFMDAKGPSGAQTKPPAGGNEPLLEKALELLEKVVSLIGQEGGGSPTSSAAEPSVAPKGFEDFSGGKTTGSSAPTDVPQDQSVGAAQMETEV